MKQPAISIIVPVYNAEKYLRRCIDSIISQSFTNFELILVDDGSSDHSPQICDEYASRNNRIKLIHKKNAGVSAARNDGLDIAQGEFITFVDSDDWVNEDYLSTLLQYKQYDIVFFSHRLIFEDGYSSEFRFEDREGVSNAIWDIVADLKKNSTKWNFFGYTWNKMFRNQIIKNNNIRFVDKLRVSEDEVYTLDYCTHAQSIKVLPVCVYNYRVLDTGLTATKNSAVEYGILADSYIAILEREKNPLIYDVYITDVTVCIYTAAMGQNSLCYAYSKLKQIKSFLGKEYVTKLNSGKMHLFVSLPIIAEMLWWVGYRVKMNMVKLIKR